MEDYYAILNVAPTTSREEIKISYKKLGLMYHPDKNQENDATEKFLEIFRAWDQLGDPGKRAVYDAQRLSYKWNKEAVARQGREKREGEAKILKEGKEERRKQLGASDREAHGWTEALRSQREAELVDADKTINAQKQAKKLILKHKAEKKQPSKALIKAERRARRNERWHQKQEKEREITEQVLADEHEKQIFLHRATHPFRFKDLPTEVRSMIYNLSLFKHGGKKPPLLRALRTEKNFYDEAIEVYYKINSFQFCVDTKSPVEEMEPRFLQLMRRVHIVLSFPKSETKLTDKLLLCTAVRDLTISTASVLGLHRGIMKYLPSFKNLLSLTVIITTPKKNSGSVENISQRLRNFQQGIYFHSPTKNDRLLENRMLGLLAKMMGQEGVVRRTERETWWLWKAGEKGKTFEIRAPVHIKFEH